MKVGINSSISTNSVRNESYNIKCRVLFRKSIIGNCMFIIKRKLLSTGS